MSAARRKGSAQVRAKGRRAEKTTGCGLIFAPWTEVKMLKHGDTVMRFLENLHRNIANQD
jgi:hypothetical protein